MTKKRRNLLYALAAAVGVWLLSRNGSGSFAAKRFVPGSAKARELFRFAAVKAGLPIAWGDSEALHYILARESGGWVGRPNYTLRTRAQGYDPKAKWPQAWALIKQVAKARIATGKNVSFPTSSSATGLGQLLAMPEWDKYGKLHKSNVMRFYPQGLDGIGDPVNEAVGMLKYIASRYGSPEVARSVYGRGGKGSAAVPYVHAITGKSRSKGFKEGY